MRADYIIQYTPILPSDVKSTNRNSRLLYWLTISEYINVSWAKVGVLSFFFFSFSAGLFFFFLAISAGSPVIYQPPQTLFDSRKTFSDLFYNELYNSNSRFKSNYAKIIKRKRSPL